jgi:hypothetical protein
VETVEFTLCSNPSPTALAPLRQLSALTGLVIHELGDPWAAAAIRGIATQLAGLRKLKLTGLPHLSVTGPSSAVKVAALQLTALTALEELQLLELSVERCVCTPLSHALVFWNKVSGNTHLCSCNLKWVLTWHQST